MRAMTARLRLAELLDPVVIGVDDVDVAVVVDRDGSRTVELTVAGAKAPPGAQEAAAGRELLDSVVAAVGDVDMAVVVDGDAPRKAQLTGAGTEAPPPAQEAAGGRELLDRVAGAAV